MKQTQVQLEETYNDLVTQINNFISSNKVIDEQILGKQKLLRIVELMNDKKTTKSKTKMPKEILCRTFIYPSEEFTFGINVNKFGKMRTLGLYKLKTSKGSIYICFFRSAENKYITLCFKAHVFDRYIIRLKNEKIKDRLSAIKHFMQLMLNVETISHRSETEEEGSSTIMILGNNFCLGINFGNLMLINTFIENSMLTPRQQMLMNTMKKWNVSNPPSFKK